MSQPERPLQPPHREPRPPKDEDEAYDEARQREADEEAFAPPPKPQACHNCGLPYVGVKCSLCGEFRPAYLALVGKR